MFRVLYIIVLLLSVLLVATGCDVPQADLLNAIRAKDEVAVKRILSQGRIELEPRNQEFEVKKPLAFAAAYGNVQIVKLLLEAGADINGRVAYGDVPGIKAAEHRNMDIVKLLIEAGADVNAANSYGVSMLIGLAGQGDLEEVKLALQHGGDINRSFECTIGKQRGTTNLSAFQMAVARGQTAIVEMLLKYGADRNARDYRNRTVMMIAEDSRNVKMIELLRSSEDRAISQ